VTNEGSNADASNSWLLTLGDKALIRYSEMILLNCS